MGCVNINYGGYDMPDYTLTQVLTAFSTLLLICGWIFVRSYFKKLPERIAQSYQHTLNTELEKLKSELAKENELTRIREAEIQANKTQIFINYSKMIQKIFIDKDFTARIEKHEPDALHELNKTFLEVANDLFFFSSDTTIIKFGQWRATSQAGTLSPAETLTALADIMVLLRKDLGYPDTTVTNDDFLRLFITDWDHFKKNNITL